MPFNFKDQMRDEFVLLDQEFITVAEYESYYYVLSKYFYTCITTKSKKIQKFMKGFDISPACYDSDDNVWSII